METLDGLDPDYINSPNATQLLDISVLRLLYVDNPLQRKMPNGNFSYAWLALGVAEKYKLDTPLWAVSVVRRTAVGSIRKSGFFGATIAAAKIKQASIDIKILLAISDYQKCLQKPITVHMIQNHKPTPMEVTEAAKKIRHNMYQEMLELEKSKERNSVQKERLAELKDHFRPIDDKKGLIAKRIAKQHGISREVLMKNYYHVSPPKKKGTKKQPSFSLSTWFPAPFSDLPF